MHLPFGPLILLLGIYPMDIHLENSICTILFITTWFLTGEKQNPKFPLVWNSHVNSVFFVCLFFLFFFFINYSETEKEGTFVCSKMGMPPGHTIRWTRQDAARGGSHTAFC